MFAKSLRNNFLRNSNKLLFNTRLSMSCHRYYHHNQFRYNQNSIPSTRKKNSQTPTKINEFIVEIKNLYERIYLGVLPLKKLNPNFIIEYPMIDNDTTLVNNNEEDLSNRLNQTFLITTERGKFSFDMDETKKLLRFQSYLSGIHYYTYDNNERVWLSNRDKHDFIGLLTRDFLKHCTGCPIFI